MDKITLRKILKYIHSISSKMSLLTKEVSTSKSCPLTLAESIIINIIGESPDINVTELSLRYGATKGAVSKMLKNLVAKKLISKRRTLQNEKEVLLSLTAPGEIIFLAQEASLDSLVKDINFNVENLSDAQLELFFKIFSAFERHLSDSLADFS